MLTKIRNTNIFVSNKCFRGITETKARTTICYELSLYIADGGVAHINDEHYEIRRGEFILASPGDVRHSTLHYVSKFVYFDTDDERLRDIIASMPKHLFTQDTKKYSLMFDELYNVFQSFDEYRDLELAAILTKMLCTLRREYLHSSDGISANGSAEIQDSLLFIENHYAEQLDIAKIAENCNMSASNFHKRFLEAIKTTPNEYLVEYRIKKAKQMLVSDNISISQIAEKCGFNSQAYFCCCFKKHEGISPGDFRKFYRII